MDPVVETLMARYHMTREQAEVYAESLRRKVLLSPMDKNLLHEANTAAFNRTVVPVIERAKRIYYFNQLNERYMAGETLTMEELQYLDRVKQAEAKRMRERAQAMLAAQKLTQMAGPAASELVEKVIPKPEPLPVAPRPPAIPDPTRYELLPPVQAFTEAFRDYSAPPPDIDPESGSPIGSQEYHAYYDEKARANAPLDLEIGPIKISPDPTARLRLLEEAAKRRKKHADYWNRPENRARRQQLDEELRAERKKLKK